MTESMHCPKCGLKYPDGYQRFCDTDGTRLVPDPSATNRPREGVFSAVLGMAAKPQVRREESRPEPNVVFELDDDVIRADDEVIRDAEMAELFRREAISIPTVPDRRMHQTDDREPFLEVPGLPVPAVSTAPRPEPQTIHRVNPFEIPLGHVDLDVRNSLEHLNDFDAKDLSAFVGKKVKGRYRVVELVGEDDAGYAYVAEDLLTDDRRVIVRILAEFEGDAITADILADERVRLSHLNHPNVARVFDSGQFTNGTKFLIAEHPDGLSAEDILQIHSKFDPARAARIIRQAAYAIGDVHKQGILHRDIRPANMEIASDEGETLKLVNFGVSAGGLYEENIDYAAPELINGGVATGASDIYALGVTAHRMLLGEFPFSQSGSVREMLRTKEAGYKGDLAPEMKSVFGRAFAADPRERFTTAREFGDAFAAAAVMPLETRSSEIVGGSATKSSAETKAAVAVTTAAVEQRNSNEPAWKMRSPELPAAPNAKWLKIALATFVALSVIFALAWIYMLRRPASTQPSAQPDQNANSIYDPTETPPPAREITPPADSAFFDNNKQNLKGDLFRNFAAFSIFYPKNWTAVGPKESTDLKSRGKFLDISRSTADKKLQEQMLISYYASRGTFSDDMSNFPNLIKESNATLSTLIPGFQVVSEGPTIINGGWKAYEVKFQGSGPVSGGQRMLVWGRRLYVPAARPGVKNGFEITMLATSNSDEIHSVDDVGNTGQLGEILATFEPGRNF